MRNCAENGKSEGLSEELREESLQVVLIDLRLLARRNAGWFEGELGLNIVGVALGELGSEGDLCLGSRRINERAISLSERLSG